MKQQGETTTDPQGLFMAYQSLRRLNRDLTEVLAVLYEPASISVLHQLLKIADTPVESGKRTGIKRSAITQAANALVKKKILTKKQNRFKCNPLVVEPIARHLARKGRFEIWVEVIEQSRYRNYSRSSRYLYFYNVDDAISVGRWAVYLDDSQTFSRVMGSYVWNDDDSGISQIDFAQAIFDSPFDPEWIFSRDPDIRNPSLGTLLATRTSDLRPADDILEVWNRIEAESLTEGLNWSRVADYTLLQGNLSATHSALKHLHPVDRHAFRGRILCMQGEYETSLESFRESIRLGKRESLRPKGLLHWKCDLYYVVSCFGSGKKLSIKEGLKYLETAIRTRPWKETFYGTLRCVGLLVGGRIQESNSLFESIKDEINSHTQFRDPQEMLMIFLVLCWIDRKSSPDLLSAIEILLLHSSEANYRWLSAEFDSVFKHISSKAHTHVEVSNHAELGCSPLMMAVDTQSVWERSLVAIERLGIESTKNRKIAKQTRLVWRASYKNEAADVSPILQTRLKSGRWSKGRKVALKHLAGDDKPEYVTLDDVRVCAAIKSRGPSHYFIDSKDAIVRLVGHPLVFQMASPTEPMEVTKDEPQLKVSSRHGNVKIRLVPKLPENGSVVISQPHTGKIIGTVFEDKHNQLINALGGGDLTVPASSKAMVNKAVAAVSGLLSVQSDIGGDGAGVVEQPADSTPKIHLTPHGKGLQAEALVAPLSEGGPSYFPGRGSRVVFSVVDQKRVKVSRNLKLESRKLSEIVKRCPVLRDAERDGDAWLVPEPLDCLELLEQLWQIGDGVVVGWPKGKPLRILGIAGTDRLALKIRKARDWFGIDGSIELDEGLVLSLRELIERSKNATGRFLRIGDREFVALTSALQKRIDDLAGYAERHGKKGLRFRPIRAHAIEGIAEEAGKLDADESWSRQLRRFRDAEQLTPTLPTTLQAQLRDYQVDGFRWASRLAAWGAGACLADDMGLGKTIQALSVALERAPNGPTLVVAPTSVCANWIDEARRFTPALSLLEFRSKNRDLLLRDLGPFDVLVCSYGLLHQESDLLSTQQWETVVLDEAQAIKNRETMRSKAAMRLRGKFRMITTGTPIENHLGEMWNLFNFINPGLLGSLESFSANYAVPIHRDKDTRVRRRLKGLLQPFILRRTKAAVLDELPPRTEITQRIEMSKEERALYEAVRLTAIASIESGDSEKGGKHLRIFAELTKLRLACCHPRLAMSETSISGSKLAAFLRIVADLKDGGHKALVFSQFVSHLAIVRESLDKAGITYRYLDGSTPKAARKREVAKFQAGASDLFLISLRAGGHGLNLTAADYVIHLDPWWNPAVEDQASDRTHRIGQTRPVTVYRMVMRDSIEEKIVDLHATKRDLADSLLEGADMSGKLSADELLGLIRKA
ncbi:MAG: DEAD/DEAH box helicase [Bryobacterales bacterium]|nr:DEAD/DEAH box helicase [Bryobacterales bacterium]